MAKSERSLLHRLRAFTLVELLVVIGIIAVLISILLPVVGKVRQQAVTVKCMSNLRSIHQALRMYAAESKDSLPWGWAWERANTVPESPSYDPSSTMYMNWASSLARYLNIKRAQPNIAGTLSANSYRDIYSEVMRCPAVEANFAQRTTYTALLTAMPDWYCEVSPSAYGDGGNGYRQGDQMRPAKFSELYPDNTLIWDSPAWIREGIQHFGNVNNDGGGPVYQFIDDGALLYPNQPDLRFRAKGGYDIYAGVDPHKSWGNPIDIPSHDVYYNTNTDSMLSTIQKGQSGVPRFRHNRDHVCNAVMADGSVRSFYADFSRNKPGKFYNDPDYVETEWLRSYILTKPQQYGGTRGQ